MIKKINIVRLQNSPSSMMLQISVFLSSFADRCVFLNFGLANILSCSPPLALILSPSLKLIATASDKSELRLPCPTVADCVYIQSHHF